jgi:hypothetical protein
MLRKLTVVAVAAFVMAMLGCGGAPQLRIYKGTSTTQITSAGGTNTITTTNQAFSVIPGDMVNEWVFLNGDSIYVGTASGMVLTFQGGQGYMQTETVGNQSYTISLSSGTGNLSTEALSLNLSGTINSNGNTGTYNLQFTGTRE